MSNHPWYTEAVTWAKERGIMDGTRPTEPATRAEVAQMFYNYAKTLQSSASAQEPLDEKRFSGLLEDED